jgi:hypothetical protein
MCNPLNSFSVCKHSIDVGRVCSDTQGACAEGARSLSYPSFAKGGVLFYVNLDVRPFSVYSLSIPENTSSCTLKYVIYRYSLSSYESFCLYVQIAAAENRKQKRGEERAAKVIPCTSLSR